MVADTQFICDETDETDNDGDNDDAVATGNDVLGFSAVVVVAVDMFVFASVDNSKVVSARLPLVSSTTDLDRAITATRPSILAPLSIPATLILLSL